MKESFLVKQINDPLLKKIVSEEKVMGERKQDCMLLAISRMILLTINFA
jgi:hypothetical protein